MFDVMVTTDGRELLLTPLQANRCLRSCTNSNRTASAAVNNIHLTKTAAVVAIFQIADDRSSGSGIRASIEPTRSAKRR
jgi:hypothetical protein